MSLLLLLGCPKPTEAPPAAAGSHVTAVSGVVNGDGQVLDERERMFAVLEASAPQAQACYQTALARDPMVYGDISFRITLGPDGSVAEADILMSTLGDLRFDECLVQVVSELAFPEPSREETTLRYPYVFTSDATPPEITRALLVRHGLIDLDEERDEQLHRSRSKNPEPPEGWVESW